MVLAGGRILGERCETMRRMGWETGVSRIAIARNKPNYPCFRAENGDSSGRQSQMKPIGPAWKYGGAGGAVGRG